MEDNSYKYLFPFEKIPRDSNVLIYGAGILGQAYLKQILITKYCKIIGFVDKNYRDYQKSSVTVYSPSEIKTLEFDYVVLALRGGFSVPDIKRILYDQNVDDRKIVYVLERILPVSVSHENDVERNGDLNLASKSEKISFAFYMSGYVGDMVTYKRLVEELHRLVPSAVMDIFSVRGIDFLQWIYYEEDYIKNIIVDLGRRYVDNRDAYSLALSFMGSGHLSVDNVIEDDFANGYEDFFIKIGMLKKEIKREDYSVAMPAAVMFFRRMYCGRNCYTGFSYGDVFSIKTKQIHVPVIEYFKKEYSELHLQKYITINIEHGLGSDSEHVAKAWPYNYFSETVKEFKKKYPDVHIVQLGSKDGKLLRNADVYMMGKNFGLVAEILRHAIFHMGIEGGLVHLASQIGTKCVVLFGPTLTSYNAYNNNINIKAGDCHGCYGLYMDTNYCARNMKEPECMYKITPKLVMRHIDGYMKNQYIFGGETG